MNIVLVDDDIEFSNKLKVDVKLYFKQLDENINFIVLNDSSNICSKLISDIRLNLLNNIIWG